MFSHHLKIFSISNAPILLRNNGISELVREGKDYQRADEFQIESTHLEGRLVNQNGTWSALWCQAPILNQKKPENI